MLYTIGYQDKDIGFFVKTLKDCGIEVLVDVRSRPSGRQASFRKQALANRMRREGFGYVWKGDTLGGFAQIADRAIEELAGFQAGRMICVMCMEANPSKCHRDYEIAWRLKMKDVRVMHIVRDGPYGIRIFEA